MHKSIIHVMAAHSTILKEKRTKQQHGGPSAHYICCETCAAGDGSAHTKCQPKDLAISAAVEQYERPLILSDGAPLVSQQMSAAAGVPGGDGPVSQAADAV